MMRHLTRLFSFPFYASLVGVYTVLFLWSVNAGQLMLADVGRSLLTVFLLCVMVFLACWALFRSHAKAGLVSALLLILLVAYGHFYALIDGAEVAGTVIGRHRFFLPLLAVLSLIVIVLVARTRANLQNITVLLNLLILAMLLMAVFPIVSYEITYGSHIYNDKKDRTGTQVEPPANAPDVYYIIVDGYTRADVLNDTFQYNNQDIDALEEMGFYLPGCSHSNYTSTIPSLSSSLNMEYPENLGISDKAAEVPFDPSLAPLVIRSKVRQEFERMGYKVAAFRGYTPALDLRDADYYFNYEVQKQQHNLIAARNFERMFLRTTILRPMVEAYELNAHGLDFLPEFVLDILYSKTDYGPYILTDMQWRDESSYTFDMLPTIPGLPGKKFVYGHIYSTHKPYVFDREGGYLSQSLRENDYEGYINTVEYTNQRLLSILKVLIEKSPVKPIIILQGDHGSAALDGVPHNRILNAYYFPDQDYSRLYDTITPVNTFRVVFNQFYGQNLSLVPDTLLIKDIAPDKSFTTRRLLAACDLE